MSVKNHIFKYQLFVAMIARHWTGLSKKEKAAGYIQHLQHDTFAKLRSIEGFMRARILHRELPEGTEFLIVTEWNSLDDIRKFAGDDMEKAVVPPLVQDMMLRYDEKSRHYQVEEQQVFES